MELIINSNSYMSLEEANTVIEDGLLDTDDEYIFWQSLSESNKQKLIIAGTRVIDNIPFIGYKYNTGLDKLQWPRVINNMYTECPREVKLALLKNIIRTNKNHAKQETKLQELGVKSYSINKASIAFGENNSAINSIGIYKDIVDELLIKWVI